MTWLLCQAATLVCATAVFGIDAVAVTMLEWTCAQGADHKDCPMHHPAAPARPGLAQLQCAGETDVALLGSLLGQVALAPAPAREIPPTSPRAVVAIDLTTHVLRPAPPGPPPPRA